MAWIRRALEGLKAWWRGDLKVVAVEGDTLPESFAPRRMVHMIDTGESWSVGFYCPCGCGDVIELLLLRSVKPHWTLAVDGLGRPTLYPSVWRSSGCKSHFWVREGRTVWVEAERSRR